MSAETGHTPGPWKADGWMDNGNHCVSASSGAVVCEVYEPENVPLIAAAPDLLSEMRAEEQFLSKLMTEFNAAIWDADRQGFTGPLRPMVMATSLRLSCVRAAIQKATTP